MAQVDPSGASPNRSVTRDCAGRVKRYSSRQDLLEALAEVGAIESPAQPLADNPECVSDMFFLWLQQGQNGCLFATILAGDPSASRWISAVVFNADENVATQLQALIDAGMRNQVNILQFLFPEINSAEEIAGLISNLCRDSRWWWTEWPPSDGNISIGLRWQLPSGHYFSATLGFADLPSMPFTRRGPFTGLILRALEPAQPGPDDWQEFGMYPVHLAQVPLPQMDQEMIDRRWVRTQKLKKVLVGDEVPQAAKARVTFSLPESVRPLLPPPRSA